MLLRKHVDIFCVLSVSTMFLSSCVSKDYSLGEIPNPYSYKFLNIQDSGTRDRVKPTSTVNSDTGEIVVGLPLEDGFDPSLLKTLDHELGSVLIEGEDRKTIDVGMFSIRFIVPDVGPHGGLAFGAMGVALENLAADRILEHGVIPDKKRDSLLCYFKGKYRNQKFVVEKSNICPDGEPHCFPYSTFPQFTLNNTQHTKDNVQNLAKECINEIKTSIANIKANQRS